MTMTHVLIFDAIDRRQPLRRGIRRLRRLPQALHRHLHTDLQRNSEHGEPLQDPARRRVSFCYLIRREWEYGVELRAEWVLVHGE